MTGLKQLAGAKHEYVLMADGKLLKFDNSHQEALVVSLVLEATRVFRTPHLKFKVYQNRIVTTIRTDTIELEESQ